MRYDKGGMGRQAWMYVRKDKDSSVDSAVVRILGQPKSCPYFGG